MFGYSHYVRVDSDGNIIHAFSTAFEQPQEGDIVVAEYADRHYNLNLWFNGVIPCWSYVNNEITKRADEEVAELWAQYLAEHPPEPTEIELLRSDNEDLKSRLSDVELALADAFAGGV